MSPRRLSDDEDALWQSITRAIAPLRKARRQERAAAQSSSSAEPPKAKSKPKSKPKSNSKPVSASASSLVTKPPAPMAPPLAPLGRRFKQRIARGMHTIDGRLDLHGMTQAQAHGALLGFLRTTQARGGRIVLVITGKGGGETYGERGVLKRQVPQWLRLPEFRRYVVGFESAGPAHGGEGALYVQIRGLKE